MRFPGLGLDDTAGISAEVPYLCSGYRTPEHWSLQCVEWPWMIYMCIGQAVSADGLVVPFTES